MKKVFRNFAYSLAALALITGCSDDDNDEGGNGNGNTDAVSKFIIAATPVSSQGVADYLLLADDIDKGTISTVGNGVEQDGTYRYYVQNGQTFVSLLYGQGNPGAVTAYRLSAEGKLEKKTDFQSETVAAFGEVNKDVLMLKMSRSFDSPIANWYRLGMESLTFDSEGTIDQLALTDSDTEMAYFSWVTQATTNKVYLPYFKIFGNGNNRFGTNDPDRAFVAVYSYPDMTYQKTITDTRTSFLGRYFISSITIDEKGDAYAFSPSFAQDDNYEFNSTKASAITQINTATDEFTDYYFDVEATSGGKFITNWIYAGKGKFVANLGTDRVETGAFSYGKDFAIVDVYNKTITEVQGVPAPDEISNITARNNYVTEDGKSVYVGITTTGEGSYVYKIDVDKATATRGIKVEGGEIAAIHKISYEAE